MGSLQDQLMKAGLATPEQLRKARAEQRRESRGKRGTRDGSRPPGLRPPKRSRAAPEPSAGKAERETGRPPPGEPGRGGPARKGGLRRRTTHDRVESARERSAESLPAGPDRAVRALNLRIRELLDRHAQNDRNAEIAFNFMRENTVRRVYVTDEQRRRLASGELAIVGFRRRHHIVPAGVAGEIQALRSIVFVHRAEGAGGGAAAPQASVEDDPYRDYPVPDDLHW